MQHLVKFMFSIVEPNGSPFLPKAIESTFMTPQPASHPLQGVFIKLSPPKNKHKLGSY